MKEINRKNKFKVLVILFAFAFSIESYTQDFAPDPNDFLENDSNPSDVIINNNILLLISAGVAFGFCCLKKSK